MIELALEYPAAFNELPLDDRNRIIRERAIMEFGLFGEGYVIESRLEGFRFLRVEDGHIEGQGGFEGSLGMVLEAASVNSAEQEDSFFSLSNWAEEMAQTANLLNHTAAPEAELISKFPVYSA